MEVCRADVEGREGKEADVVDRHGPRPEAPCSSCSAMGGEPRRSGKGLERMEASGSPLKDRD